MKAMDILECRQIGEMFEFSYTLSRKGDFVKFCEGMFSTKDECVLEIIKRATEKIMKGEDFMFIGVDNNE